HVFVELGLLLCWYLLVTGVDLTSYSRRTVIFCLTLGWLPVLRYPAAVIVFAVFLYLLFSPSRPSPGRRTEWFALLDNGLIVAAPITLLLYYNTVCFGVPWTSYGPFSSADWYHRWYTAFDSAWGHGVVTL